MSTDSSGRIIGRGTGITLGLAFGMVSLIVAGAAMWIKVRDDAVEGYRSIELKMGTAYQEFGERLNEITISERETATHLGELEKAFNRWIDGENKRYHELHARMMQVEMNAVKLESRIAALEKK